MSMTDTERYGTGLPGAGLADAGFPAERVSLVDLLDRVLAGGVVVTGEITLSIADGDLGVISLRPLLTSVSALMEPEGERQRGASRARRARWSRRARGSGTGWTPTVTRGQPSAAWPRSCSRSWSCCGS